MSFDLLNFLVNPLKLVIFIVMLVIAHGVLNGRFDGYIKKFEKFKKRYGIVTVLLIVVWWLVTPSGNVDDVITVWLISVLGMTWYVVSVGLLTMYIIWRLKVTIVIYRT